MARNRQKNIHFNTNKELAASVNKITKEELIAFYKVLIKNKGNSLLVYTTNNESDDKISLEGVSRLTQETKLDTFMNKE